MGFEISLVVILLLFLKPLILTQVSFRVRIIYLFLIDVIIFRRNLVHFIGAWLSHPIIPIFALLNLLIFRVENRIVRTLCVLTRIA